VCVSLSSVTASHTVNCPRFRLASSFRTEANGERAHRPSRCERKLRDKGVRAIRVSPKLIVNDLGSLRSCCVREFCDNSRKSRSAIVGLASICPSAGRASWPDSHAPLVGAVATGVGLTQVRCQLEASDVTSGANSGWSGAQWTVFPDGMIRFRCRRVNPIAASSVRFALTPGANKFMRVTRAGMREPPVTARTLMASWPWPARPCPVLRTPPPLQC
jgi:hypothetical protein